jgi:hypothetical protein
MALLILQGDECVGLAHAQFDLFPLPVLACCRNWVPTKDSLTTAVRCRTVGGLAQASHPLAGGSLGWPYE